MRAVPRLCGFYPGICLTTEEKARKNLSTYCNPDTTQPNSDTRRRYIPGRCPVIRHERQCTYTAIVKRVRVNHCCCGNRLSTTYSECVLVALVNQQAKRMRRILLPFVDYWLYRGLPHCVKRDDFPGGRG